MFFDPELTNVLRALMPWAGDFFKLMTQLGSETFYIGLVLIGFWAYNKRESVLTIAILLTSVVSNYLLKLAIMNPRPDQSYWYPGVEATNYSTPSGHSQNSAALFGWFAARSKKWWMFILSPVLIILIGVSRIYLGVHYLGDVLIGWAVGFLILLVFYFAERPLHELFVKREELSYLVVFLLGLGLTVVTTYLIPLPPGDNFGALGGLLMGIAIAFPIESRYINFDVAPPNGQTWRLVVRVIIGLVLVIGSLALLSPIMPTANVWLRALRYGLVVIVGIDVWPLIFKRVSL